MTPSETIRHHALSLHDMADRVGRVSRTARGVPMMVHALLGEVEERARACAEDLTAMAEEMDGDSGVDGDTLMTLSGKPKGSSVRPSREATSGESPVGSTTDRRREGLPASVSDDRDGSRTSGFDSHLSPSEMDAPEGGEVRRDEGQSPSERAALVDAGRGHLVR